MIQMWKIPNGVDIDFVKSLQGEQGTFLYPVQDINGYWFLSNEECISDEFNSIKIQYSDIVDQMELVEYIATPRVLPQ